MVVPLETDRPSLADRRIPSVQIPSQYLIGAVVLLAALPSATTIVSAQSSATLPPVTVDAPTQKRKPARTAGTSAQRVQAAAARQRNRAAPAEPTPSERAAAAGAKLNKAKL